MTTKPHFLGSLQRVPLREAWRHEASDFTPWLAEPENLGLLAEALGIDDLEPVGIEQWVGEFKVDILATAGDEQVIIENQLAKTDHNHLGQIITYAAGIDARKVIWIAEAFRPEHIAALHFLNEHTTEALNFFGVQIELYRIGDSPLAPKFEVVVKPSAWAKSGREQAKAATVATPTKQRQLQFWLALVDELAKKAPGIQPQKPRAQHWQQIKVGRSGFVLTVTARERDGRLGVEIYINRVDAKERFGQLAAQRSEIEGRLGFPLEWQELPDARACRIAVYRSDCPLEDESRWPEYLDWANQHIVRFDAVFRPVIKGLP
jgi:hypothetical protein